MSDLQVRIATADELPAFAALREQGYAIPTGGREQWIDDLSSTGRADRLIGAFRGGQLVGMLNVLAFEQWFGGRAVPMGGVASVVVAPEARGRGIAPRLLERALALMTERGEAISTLGPATSWVYRKSGWEHAGLYRVASVPTADLVGLPEGGARERRATAADRPAIIAAYDRAAALRPGYLARPGWLWDERLRDVPHRYVYVVEREGAVAGYVVYTEAAAARGITVWVDDLVAVDVDAERTLWRHLGAHAAQTERITVAGVPLDALAHLLPEQTIRPLGQQVWMTRIVDAPAAIAARGYATGIGASVDLQLTDPVVAANNGNWRLVVEAGAGRLEALAGSSAPEAAMTVNGLAALYTGWTSAAALVQSGLAHGLTPATLAQLDAIFSGRRPTMCDDF